MDQRHEFAVTSGGEPDVMTRLGPVAGDRETLVAAGDQLDRPVEPACRDRESQAAQHPRAVDQHCAGPALAVVAALLGAIQTQGLAQRIQQGRAGVDVQCADLAVDGDRSLQARASGERTQTLV